MGRFIDKLKSLFGRKKPMEEPEPTWIEREGNRFGVRILDCRPIVMNLTAWTSSKEIAESFNRLRASDGSEYVGQSPEDGTKIEANLCFPYNGKHNDGPVFKAQVMEDKWDMYLYGNRLYISRSWTGQLCFVAECEFKPDCVEIREIIARKEFAQDEPVYIERFVDFLVKSHMSNMAIPHPIPRNMEGASPNELALHSFSTFGRRGLFGTFEETRGIWGQQPTATDG